MIENLARLIKAQKERAHAALPAHGAVSTRRALVHGCGGSSEPRMHIERQLPVVAHPQVLDATMLQHNRQYSGPRPAFAHVSRMHESFSTTNRSREKGELVRHPSRNTVEIYTTQPSIIVSLPPMPQKRGASSCRC